MRKQYAFKIYDFNKLGLFKSCKDLKSIDKWINFDNNNNNKLSKRISIYIIKKNTNYKLVFLLAFLVSWCLPLHARAKVRKTKLLLKSSILKAQPSRLVEFN